MQTHYFSRPSFDLLIYLFNYIVVELHFFTLVIDSLAHSVHSFLRLKTSAAALYDFRKHNYSINLFLKCLQLNMRTLKAHLIFDSSPVIACLLALTISHTHTHSTHRCSHHAINRRIRNLLSKVVPLFSAQVKFFVYFFPNLTVNQTAASERIANKQQKKNNFNICRKENISTFFRQTEWNIEMRAMV